MKRIIVLFLTIFTLGVLSAVDPSNTDISLKIDLNPTYLFTVNTSVVDENDESIPDPVDSATGIVLSYDKDSFVLEPTAENAYYISYIFKEYNACSFSAKLDGDLIAAGYDSSTAGENEKIPFEAVVTVGSSSQTMYSGTKNSIEILKISKAASKVAERSQASFALRITPSSSEGADSLKNKKVAVYTSHLILTVTEEE